MELTATELRVLGCLLEKHLATPQYYPLTLNALVAACNQTSNRDPVMTMGEADVAGAIARLRDLGLARLVHSPGQRASKYRHVLDEAWGLDDDHRALLAVLCLRGPQTLNELRIRTERLAPFSAPGGVEGVLDLLGRRDEALATQLPRQPGQKEVRYTHLLAEPDRPHPGLTQPGLTEPDLTEPGPMVLSPPAEGPARPDPLSERVSALEHEVAALWSALRSGPADGGA